MPRARQGAGRHDNPERYGALYSSRSPESAVAELLQAFRGQPVTDRELRRVDGRAYAIAALDDSNLPYLPDLDDPRELAARRLRPSQVATRTRSITRPLALAIFGEGVPGFAWWSTLEAAWSNVTLFAERAAPHLRIADVQLLTLRTPSVQAAAEMLGIRLAS